MNWVCLVLVILFLLALGIFLWMQFRPQRGPLRVREFKRNAQSVPSRPMGPVPMMASEPDPELTAKALAGDDGSLELIPQDEDEPRRLTLQDKMRSRAEAMKLPETIEGVPISLEKLYAVQHSQRPRIVTGLNRLAQLADPIRGDLPIERGYNVVRSQYGEESRRDIR